MGAAGGRAGTTALPLLPSPTDRPAAGGGRWQRIAATLPGNATSLVVNLAADAGTTASAQVAVASTPAGPELTATSGTTLHTVPLPATTAGADVTVEARVTAGPGTVRIAAALVTGQPGGDR